MIRDGLLFGLLVSAGLIFGAAVGLSCYETATGPTTNCAVNPYQQGCYPPIHDERADAGR